MNKFYFVQSSYAATKACAMEQEIRRDATRRYLHHIIREDDIPAIVEELQDFQLELSHGNRRLRHVPIEARDNPMVSEIKYIGIGDSYLILIEVKGSVKESSASELFNDGWWNCMEDFACMASQVLDPGQLEDVLFDVMSDAGISSVEAHLRSQYIGVSDIFDIVRRYSETKFVE